MLGSGACQTVTDIVLVNRDTVALPLEQVAWWSAASGVSLHDGGWPESTPVHLVRPPTARVRTVATPLDRTALGACRRTSLRGPLAPGATSRCLRFRRSPPRLQPRRHTPQPALCSTVSPWSRQICCPAAECYLCRWRVGAGASRFRDLALFA